MKKLTTLASVIATINAESSSEAYYEGGPSPWGDQGGGYFITRRGGGVAVHRHRVTLWRDGEIVDRAVALAAREARRAANRAREARSALARDAIDSAIARGIPVGFTEGQEGGTLYMGDHCVSARGAFARATNKKWSTVWEGEGYYRFVEWVAEVTAPGGRGFLPSRQRGCALAEHYAA